MKRFCLGFLFFWCSLSVNAESGILVSPEMNGVPAWKVASVFEDKLGTGVPEELLSPASDALFRPLQSPNLGFSSSQFWIRLPVQNLTEQSQKWKLEFNFPILDEVEIYGKVLSENQFTKLGDSFPFSQRNEEYRNPVFSFVEPPQSQSVYLLRIKSKSTIPLNLEAYSKREFYAKVSKEQIIFGLFYGIMFAMVLYNAFILFSTRDLAYVSYLGFIISISFFHLTNNGLAFQYFWPDNIWWANHALPFFMILSCVAGTLFASQFLETFSEKSRYGKLVLYWWIALVILLLPSLFLSYHASIIMSILTVVLTAILLIYSGIRAFLRKVRTARFYLLAWTFFLLCVCLYSFKSLGVLPDVVFTRWSLQMGTALLVILFAFGLADKINFLSKELQKTVTDLQKAKEQIEESEKRFKEIFEGSEEVILLLNEDQKIINANRALSKYLGFKPADLQGKSILDLIYQGKTKKDGYAKIFMTEKLKELFATGRPVRFQNEFSQKYVMEPRDMNCRLQFVDLGGSREILVTMSTLGEDAISRLILTERIEFSMNNYLRNAEIVSQKITSQLHKFVDTMTQTEVRTSVREIIINAIEHGNLGIGFEEKTKAIAEGNYLEYVQKRQEDPRFSNKKVRIEYVLNSDYIAFRITDEGNGFDHKKMMAKKSEEVNLNLEQHGRGIFMTKSVFDKIEYNEKGNQVSLVKYFNPTEEA